MLREEEGVGGGIECVLPHDEVTVGVGLGLQHTEVSEENVRRVVDAGEGIRETRH